MTSQKTILKAAKLEKRAIPAFNVSSVEVLQAIFEAAGELSYPIIVETSKGESEHLTPELLFKLCEALAEYHNVMYSLHLDRANDWDLIKRCLDAGYNSISGEFKESDYQKNVELTIKLRELTDKYNAQLEGVMEVVPLKYYQNTKMSELIITDPEKAIEFAKETDADSLVISIGTQSGAYKQIGAIRYDVLNEVNANLAELPFVLHGGSYLPEEVCSRCIENGVAKININAELRKAYTNRLKENILEKPDEYAPYRLLKGAKESMKLIAKEKIKMYSGRNSHEQ